ncbi:MAG: YkgJ family cysteine cluster protein [Prosthecobacter sp.]|nr:YkgJ family cysteine cluster protein [Prosthecobacter sp.]
MPRRRPKSPQLPPEALAEITAIYTALEQRALPRACTGQAGCCHFRITGRTPQLTRGEALYAMQGVRASGRREIRPHPEGACPLLAKDGRCTIYRHRPFGCRTHFCQAAGGMYPRRHVADLIQRLEALDEKLGGDGPHPLEKALTQA